MRLRRLRLENYGCFDNAKLEFATEPGRITLVTAPNGAGKSVLRQAFHDLLFDIPLQSEMKFRFGYPGMALHADALEADGAAFSFGWVRGGRPPRVTSDEARYAALRAGITPRQLEQLYALDTARLRQGGTDLKGEKSLAGALLAGTGELARPRRVRAELEERRKANWEKGKQKPRLNAALSALAEAGKQARSAVQRPQHREQAENALRAQRDAEAAARAALAAAKAESRLLFRIELTRPHLQLLAEAEAWLAANPDAPALPPGLEQPLADARAAITRAHTERTLAETAVADAERAAAAIIRDPALEPHRAALAPLPEQLGKAAEAAQDIITVSAERDALHDEIRVALRDIGAQATAATAAALIPPLATLSRARAMITEHGTLRAACAEAASRLADAHARLVEAEQAQKPPPPVPDGLEALMAEIHADRNPAQHVKEAADQDRLAAARLRAALASVPGWTGGAEALLALPVPVSGVFEHLHDARQAADMALNDAASAVTRLAARHEAARTALAGLSDKPLPDDAAIAAARARRDLGWRLIHGRAFGGSPPDEAAERHFAGAEPLPLAFERALRGADTLADQRIAELDRVQRAAALTREVSSLEADLAAGRAREAACRARAAEAAQAWARALAPLGLPDDAGIADLRSFVSARLAVLEAWKLAEPAASALRDLQAAHGAWAVRLAAMLGAPAAPLAALLPPAAALLDTAKTAEKALLIWQTKLQSARTVLSGEQEKQRQASAALAAFDAPWTDMLAALRRPPGEAPAITAIVLDRVAALDRLIRETAKLDERIDGMQLILDRFGATVRGLEADLAAPPENDPFDGARALIARRDHAARQGSAWDQAQQTLGQKRDALRAARDAAHAAELARDAVVAAAGATDLDDAALRIAASREHTRHAAQRDQARAALRDHGDGVDRATLQQQADAAPADSMPARRAEATAREESAARTLEAEAVKASAMQTEFDAGSDAGETLDAEASLQAAASEYARLLDEQLVLQLAGLMLTSAMAEVEAEAGDGGLGRLSDMFSQVTNGAYGVAIDEADGTTLCAVEHRWPKERRDLAELSEGTRDQLYLALRLIALGEQAASGTTLPFIADDILQTFDDDRARAALGALLTLSEQVQVIVLTHHAHLSALAEPFGAAIHRQSLP
jgi:uncharacterized protein YhaN